jgi:hypothetical protein
MMTASTIAPISHHNHAGVEFVLLEVGVTASVWAAVDVGVGVAGSGVGASVTVGAAVTVGGRVTVAVVVAVAVSVDAGFAVGVRVTVGRDVAVDAEVSVGAAAAVDVADGGASVRAVSRDRDGDREG